MNISVFLIETIAATVVFTLMILIPLYRNPVWWIHDYPEDIQEEYFKTHERIPAAPLSKPAIIKKSFALLLAVAVLTLLAKLAGGKDFITGFGISYSFWLIINWYDCFFLDWVLFANIKQVRLPGTEHMDREYHQKMYHVKHAFAGMAIGLIPCVIVGIILAIVK